MHQWTYAPLHHCIHASINQCINAVYTNMWCVDHVYTCSMCSMYMHTASVFGCCFLLLWISILIIWHHGFFSGTRFTCYGVAFTCNQLSSLVAALWAMARSYCPHLPQWMLALCASAAILLCSQPPPGPLVLPFLALCACFGLSHSPHHAGVPHLTTFCMLTLSDTITMLPSLKWLRRCSHVATKHRPTSH